MQTRAIIKILYVSGSVIPFAGIPLLIVGRIIETISNYREEKKKEYQESIKGLIKL